MRSHSSYFPPLNVGHEATDPPSPPPKTSSTLKSKIQQRKLIKTHLSCRIIKSYSAQSTLRHISSTCPIELSPAQLTILGLGTLISSTTAIIHMSNCAVIIKSCNDQTSSMLIILICFSCLGCLLHPQLLSIPPSRSSSAPLIGLLSARYYVFQFGHLITRPSRLTSIILLSGISFILLMFSPVIFFPVIPLPYCHCQSSGKYGQHYAKW